MRRVLTAAVLIPLVAFVIFYGPTVLFQLVTAALAFICFHEYTTIASAQGVRIPEWLGHVCGIVFLFAPWTGWQTPLAITMFIMAWALRSDKLTDCLPLAASVLLGVVYIYGAWKCAGILRDYNVWWIFFAVSINWVGDSAAMYAGKKFGKHKLAPVVSPGKTWEGAIASALFSTIYGVVLLGRFLPEVPMAHVIAISLAACIAGQIGDLAESALKRGAGMKDSGNLLPGHGGWLDRLDSTLFSMPTVAIYLGTIQ